MEKIILRSAMPRTWDVEVLVAISPDDPPHCLLGKVSCGGDFEQWAEIPTTDIVRAYRMFPLFVACLKHGTSFEEAATLAYAGSIYPFPQSNISSQELLYRLWEVLGSEQLTRLTSVLPQISWVETQVRAVLGVGIKPTYQSLIRYTKMVECSSPYLQTVIEKLRYLDAHPN